VEMMKALAQALQGQHDSDIPANYDALISLTGVMYRVAIFYLNYLAERSEVSLLPVWEYFSFGSGY